MTKPRPAYVLVTCLYLLAILSISGLAALQSASLLAQQTRLFEESRRDLREAQGSLQMAEATLLSGGLVPPAAAVRCDTSVVERTRVFRLHERWVSGVDDGGDVVSGTWVVYGIQACRNGRAVVESTVGMVEPIGAINETALPPNLKLGRLSWRRVW